MGWWIAAAYLVGWFVGYHHIVWLMRRADPLVTDQDRGHALVAAVWWPVMLPVLWMIMGVYAAKERKSYRKVR